MKNQEINHIPLTEIDSTQSYLIEKTELYNSATLVSTLNQTNGTGQYGRNWISSPQNLAFSFTCQLNKVVTLTSLEIAVLVAQFFKEIHQTDIKVKWPNDLMNPQGKKIGGIILNKVNDQRAIVGIGINIKSTPQGEFLTEADHLNLNIDQHLTSFEIYHYIINHRLSADDVIDRWNNMCSHINLKVLFKDNEKETQGIFIGIGENGQARIQTNNSLLDFYSGSIIRFG